MAYLLFERRGGFLMQVSLNGAKSVGRQDADISVPDPSLPEVQAELSLVDRDCRVIDRSGRGTLVNGKSVKDALVSEGAKIAFGDCVATFTHYPVAVPASEGATAPGTAPDVLPSELWVMAEIPGEADTRRQVRLDEKLEIGSKVGAGGLRLISPRVSAKHALLSRERTQLVLHDTGSTNGTWFHEGRAYELGLPLDARFRIGPYDVWVTAPQKVKASHAVEWLGEMSSVDPVMHALFAEIKRIATLSIPVWVHGESGSGKELVAKALHTQSGRPAAQYLALNCANLEPESAESELFGHNKGAFTGATSARLGAFRTADGGTLFLDEVAELKNELQAKFLRVLEVGEVKPMGRDSTVKVSVRVVVASHRSLDIEMAAGRFRPDLFYRLNVARVAVPTLRDRPGDIIHLWRRFLEERLRTPTVAPDVEPLLLAHPWPGNVRELKSAVERTLYRIYPRNHIEARDIPLDAPGPVTALGGLVDPKGKTWEQLEAAMLAAVMRLVKGSRNEACRQLGIDKKRLRRMLKEYGLEEMGREEDEEG